MTLSAAVVVSSPGEGSTITCSTVVPLVMTTARCKRKISPSEYSKVNVLAFARGEPSRGLASKRRPSAPTNAPLSSAMK